MKNSLEILLDSYSTPQRSTVNHFLFQALEIEDWVCLEKANKTNAIFPSYLFFMIPLKRKIGIYSSDW